MAENCKAQPLGGGQCQLAAGHDGKHKRTSYPYGPEGKPFVFEWSDESQRDLTAKYTSRFD
jgi:hypothetical protein